MKHICQKMPWKYIYIYMYMAYGMAMASRSHHFNCGAKLRSAVVHGVAYPQATAERQRLINPFGGFISWKSQSKMDENWGYPHDSGKLHFATSLMWPSEKNTFAKIPRRLSTQYCSHHEAPCVWMTCPSCRSVASIPKNSRECLQKDFSCNQPSKTKVWDWHTWTSNNGSGLKMALVVVPLLHWFPLFRHFPLKGAERATVVLAF